MNDSGELANDELADDGEVPESSGESNESSEPAEME